MRCVSRLKSKPNFFENLFTIIVEQPTTEYQKKYLVYEHIHGVT